MKKLSLITLTVFCALKLYSQPKSFELGNPNAIELTANNLNLLQETYWRIRKIDTKTREHLVDSKGYGSIEYFDNGTFKYSGRNGTWELLESKFIKHQLDDIEVERRFNFGGIYSATELTDTTLVLTKILTSTNDMSRTIYLRNYDKSRATQPVPFVYDQSMNEKVIDSLSSLSILLWQLSCFWISFSDRSSSWIPLQGLGSFASLVLFTTSGILSLVRRYM